MRPACCHSRRLSESRMRENLTYGLMRGRRKRAVGLLDRDTHPKGEKRPGVAGPATVPRHCPTLRLLNVLDKLPVKRQAEARSLLTKIPYAETRDNAERQKRAFQAWCTKHGHAEVGRVLERDWERLVTFYQFPREHWKHLRTSNPIESPFAAVRLRTAAAKRFKKVENATAVIWKTLLIAEKTFRRLDAPELLADVASGVVYVNGVRAVDRGDDKVAA
ncbi:MAG: hypothetical protein DMD89_35585 [Candidatus Rokuibacteriota bacterium]|nr:MAG: hypothetical protein DMD89_35585 [Candidatus Rokubacteria bacterium]